MELLLYFLQVVCTVKYCGQLYSQQLVLTTVEGLCNKYKGITNGDLFWGEKLELAYGKKAHSLRIIQQ